MNLILLKNKKIKKAFTLIEMLIVTVILVIIFWVIIKTVYWMNLHNIRIAEEIQSLTQKMKLESFFTDNSIKKVIDAYVPLGNTEMYNKSDYASNDYKSMINEIVFSKKWLWIRKTVTINLKGIDKTLSLPYLIFKDENDKLWVIWFVDDLSNKDIQALSLKIFFLNNNFYFKTKGNITLSNLLYYFQNKSNNDLLSKYNDYINDLKLSGRTILNKIVFISNDKTWQYNSINYITPTLLNSYLILFPNKNMENTNPEALNIYQKFLDDLWYSNVCYGNLNFQYYKGWKLYWLFDNFLIK